jgi:EAL domain-containing protein (putative c-di-GMP-specific phosphodiesterase class I)
LPISSLKIDASFVRSILSGDVNRTIVKTVIDMAHGLGMRAIAEGVEQPEIDALLKLMGCDHGQGYYYGRPVLAADVPALIATLARPKDPPLLAERRLAKVAGFSR